MTNKKIAGLASICIVLWSISSITGILLNQSANELEFKSDQIFQIENDRAVLESQILDFQSKIAALEEDNLALQSQVSSLQSKVPILEKETTQSYNEGYINGEAEGYLKGVADGAGTGYSIRDPTYAEAMAFIASDQTDMNNYADNYVCMNFVADFKNNAFNSGFRVGCVYIQFPERFHHGIACFDTVDNGMLFVETQTDEIVNLATGEFYYDRTIQDPPYFDDTIIHYVVIW